MEWKKELLEMIEFENISHKEQKEKVAKQIAQKVKDGDVIGFGSGSTSYLAAIEIGKKLKEENISITAIPTSYEMKLLCSFYHIPTATLLEKRPDWSFDGADEVDTNKWLIKGRGGAMFQEKLNMANSKITYILIDESKKVKSLGESFSIPVECYPESIHYVREELILLGAEKVEIRRAVAKDGPVFTENEYVILDAKFNEINEHLEKDIKSITGVIESGLFIGYRTEIITIS